MMIIAILNQALLLFWDIVMVICGSVGGIEADCGGNGSDGSHSCYAVDMVSV